MEYTSIGYRYRGIHGYRVWLSCNTTVQFEGLEVSHEVKILLPSSP